MEKYSFSANFISQKNFSYLVIIQLFSSLTFWKTWLLNIIKYYFTRVIATYNFYNVVNMVMIYSVDITMTGVIQLSNHVYRIIL